jgi:hypothetical protein
LDAKELGKGCPEFAVFFHSLLTATVEEVSPAK